MDLEFIPENSSPRRVLKKRILSEDDFKTIITNRIEYLKHEGIDNDKVIIELRNILHIVGNNGMDTKNTPRFIIDIVLENMKLSHKDVYTRNENGYLSQNKDCTLCRAITLYFIGRYTTLSVDDIMYRYLGQQTSFNGYALRKSLSAKAGDDASLRARMIMIDDSVQRYLSTKLRTFRRREPIDFLNI